MRKTGKFGHSTPEATILTRAEKVSSFAIIADKLSNTVVIFALEIIEIGSWLRLGCTMRTKYAISDDSSEIAFLHTYCPSVTQYVFSLSAEHCFQNYAKTQSRTNRPRLRTLYEQCSQAFRHMRHRAQAGRGLTKDPNVCTTTPSRHSRQRTMTF